MIYAIAEQGEYDQWCYVVIELDEKDKNKLIKYCEQSKAIDERPEWAFDLMYWAKDIEAIDKDNAERIITIEDIKERLTEQIGCINQMKEKHYLYSKREAITKLLEIL